MVRDFFRFLPLCLLAGVLSGQGCRQGAGEIRGDGESPETVRALKYRTYIFESSLEASHGMGHWIEEIYFPERKVVSNLELVGGSIGGDGQARYKPRARAFYSDIRNKFYLGLTDKKKTEEPTEEFQVPLDLAEALFDLAELTRREEEEGLRLGKIALDSRVLGPVSEGKAREKAKEK